MVFKRKSQKSEVDYLLQRGSNIVSIFSKTITDLEDLTEDTNQVVTLKQEEVNKLNGEIGILTNLMTENTKIVTKISSFLNS